MNEHESEEIREVRKWAVQMVVGPIVDAWKISNQVTDLNIETLIEQATKLSIKLLVTHECTRLFFVTNRSRTHFLAGTA